MDVDENDGHLSPAKFEELRLRVGRLEEEVAALRSAREAQRPQIAPPPFARETPMAGDAAGVQDPVSVPATGTSVPPPPPPKVSLENRLGSQVFNRIGIVALLIGTTWFLKLAIDNHWIGPLGRVAVGLVAGAGIVLWSERFRRQGVAGFSYSLKAVGSGVLYLSLWAAFQLYHLLPGWVALGAMVLVTAWNAFMAWSQDAELLAGYALIGAFATPLLLSTGGNHEIFLFTYLLAIDAATVLLVRLKGWPRLLIGSFPATVSYFVGWYFSFYRPEALGVTALFVGLFWLTFLSASIGVWRGRTGVVMVGQRPVVAYFSEVLLPLGNAAFVGLGLYAALRDAGDRAALPWLMVVLAGVYLGVMRVPQGRVASAIHLSLAVVFLTIAVPLKASGHWITVAWLVEGVALSWVAARLASSGADAEGDSRELRDDTVLRWLASGALGLGFVAVFTSSYWFRPEMQSGFFNHDLGTALVGIASFGAVAWLGWRKRRGRTAALALIAANALAVLISFREIVVSRFNGEARTAFLNPEFGMALVGMAVLGGAAYAAIRLGRGAEDDPVRLRVWTWVAGGSVIAFNLVAVLTGVREIGSFWSYSAKNPSNGLKEALAVSAFLMVYSAALLAAGFWKRSAFVRWQGLLLLVFTIGKTFLYDMSSLSQGYRVLSFLGLGVLLMAVSFAYQKDWLGLREAGVSGPVLKEEA